MNNNLYEFGGACDVIIRCASARTIGGKEYAANEPYTKLEDVFVDVQYTTIGSDANSKTNVVASREAYPHIVNIRGLTLTDKINNLIATKIAPQTIGHSCTSCAQDGIIYLPEKVLANTIFVYNGNNRIINFVVDDESDSLRSEEFEDGKIYLIFYDTIASSASFDLLAPHYGYFTLEIFGKGNTDKKTKDIYMKFPACSLMSTAMFNFINGNILNAPLQFQCVQKNQPTPYFNIGE